MERIFLLSPANSAGKRAQLLLNGRAAFDLAQRLRVKRVPLGEIFSFLSGLYFRGKLAYAREFARPREGLAGAFVITSNRGLLPVETLLNLDELRDFAEAEIDAQNPDYCRPLLRSARWLGRNVKPSSEIVLLGSIATGKYLDVLSPIFGNRLLFPEEFIGRGDMSRGRMMLRCVKERRELKYILASGAVRRGARPPKLR